MVLGTSDWDFSWLGITWTPSANKRPFTQFPLCTFCGLQPGIDPFTIPVSLFCYYSPRHRKSILLMKPHMKRWREWNKNRFRFRDNLENLLFTINWCSLNICMYKHIYITRPEGWRQNWEFTCAWKVETIFYLTNMYNQ